jgi:hypothetical protein
MTDQVQPPAEGLADLLAETRKHVEEQARSEFGSITLGNVSAPIIRRPDGRVDYIPLADIENYSGTPFFRRGTAQMTTLESFIAHVNRFGDGDSAVFANDDRFTPSLLAVLDYHRKDRLANADDEGVSGETVHGLYRHGRHRTLFNFPLADEWSAWNGHNAMPLTMAEFAQFIEDRVGDIALVDGTVPESSKRFVETNGGPNMIADYGTLIELARGLRVNENSVVEETVTLSSGESSIRLSSQHTDTKIGHQTIKVPTMFFIEVPVFNRGVVYRIPVRLRYRKTPTGLTFSYELYRADRAFENALSEAVERVRVETTAQVFYGSPE